MGPNEPTNLGDLVTIKCTVYKKKGVKHDKHPPQCWMVLINTSNTVCLLQDFKQTKDSMSHEF